MLFTQAYGLFKLTCVSENVDPHFLFGFSLLFMFYKNNVFFWILINIYM